MGIGSGELSMCHDHCREGGVDRLRIGGGIHVEDAGARDRDIDRPVLVWNWLLMESVPLTQWIGPAPNCFVF